MTFDIKIFVKSTIILTSPTVKFCFSISQFYLKAMHAYKNSLFQKLQILIQKKKFDILSSLQKI